MNSILKEIAKLRNGTPMKIDYQNSNRYRIVAIESNKTKTAYYFTTPIYNNRTHKVVDMKFHTNNSTIYSIGSGANITISNSIRMENAEGLCIASLTDHVRLVSESKAVCNSERISPTTNGVAIWSACSDGKPYSFTLEVSKPVLEVRANDKCFALMSEKFRPFIVVSCLGTTDANDNIIFPAKLRYEKLCDCKYSIIISPCSTLGKSVAFELNLYESKLFQDTTVESKNPEINNVFGSVGFIGSTQEFGEQWLYTRPDISKMNDLYEKEILGAILHLPRLNHSEIALTASRVSERFCSFGSTWDNRIATASSFSNPLIREHYLDLNIMPILTNKYGKLVQSQGFILKAKANSSDFAVIATADNYFHPQIFEINYK